MITFEKAAVADLTLNVSRLLVYFTHRDVLILPVHGNDTCVAVAPLTTEVGVETQFHLTTQLLSPREYYDVMKMKIQMLAQHF